MKRRKWKTVYTIKGFPVPETKHYPWRCAVWSSFETCYTKAITKDEAKRLIKERILRKNTRKDPQNDFQIVEERIRVE